jgi:hypothetical protein
MEAMHEQNTPQTNKAQTQMPDSVARERRCVVSVEYTAMAWKANMSELPEARLTLLVLADNEHDGVVYTSVRVIAAKTQLPEHVVVRHLVWLRDVGILQFHISYVAPFRIVIVAQHLEASHEPG